MITLALLFVASFLPRRVESLAFLHRLGFGYFALNFLLSTLDRPIRFNGALETNLVDALNTFTAVQSDSALFHLFFVFVTLILVAFFYGTVDRFLLQNGQEIEFPILVVFIAGSALIVFYVHTLIEFLLALETLTLASYVCAGYERQNRHSTYASVQYFILGALPSGFLILGIGLLYSQTGVMSFEDLDLISYQNTAFQAEHSLALIQEELTVNTIMVPTLESELNLVYSLTNNVIFPENNLVDQVVEIVSTRTSAFLAGILFILFNL